MNALAEDSTNDSTENCSVKGLNDALTKDAEQLRQTLRGYALGEVLSAPFQGLLPAFETQAPRPARVQEGLHEALTTLLSASFSAAATLNAARIKGVAQDTSLAASYFVDELVALSDASCWRGPHADAFSSTGIGLKKASLTSCLPVKKASNPALAALLPFAFLKQDLSEILPTAGMFAATLTRHSQVASAMGLFLGGFQALLHEENAEIWPKSANTAQWAQAEMQQQWGKKTLGNALQTEGARAMLLAQAKQAKHPADLRPPPGYDGREEPQRLVLVALLSASLSLDAKVHFVEETLRLAAHVDVLLPLICALGGMLHGASFNNALGCKLQAEDVLYRRAQAFFADHSPSSAQNSTTQSLLLQEEKSLRQSVQAAQKEKANASDALSTTGLNVDKNGQLSFL